MLLNKYIFAIPISSTYIERDDHFILHSNAYIAGYLSVLPFISILNILHCGVSLFNVGYVKVILYSYLILKKMNERITDS